VPTRTCQSVSFVSTWRWRSVGARVAAVSSACHDRTSARPTAALTVLLSEQRRDDTRLLSACDGSHRGTVSWTSLAQSPQPRHDTVRYLHTADGRWSYAPSLVTDAGVRRLRSADTRTLVAGRTQIYFGDRTFAAAATRLWNSLPPDIRQPDVSYGQFRRSLKTFLCGL